MIANMTITENRIREIQSASAIDPELHVPPCKHMLLRKNMDLINNYGHDALDHL